MHINMHVFPSKPIPSLEVLRGGTFIVKCWYCVNIVCGVVVFVGRILFLDMYLHWQFLILSIFFVFDCCHSAEINVNFASQCLPFFLSITGAITITLAIVAALLHGFTDGRTQVFAVFVPFALGTRCYYHVVSQTFKPPPPWKVQTR